MTRSASFSAFTLDLLCVLCALCGKASSEFTTEGTESTEPLRVQRFLSPRAGQFPKFLAVIYGPTHVATPALETRFDPARGSH